MSEPSTAAASQVSLSRRSRWFGRLLALLLVLVLAGSTYWLVKRASVPAGPGFFGGAPAMAATVGVAPARQGELPIVIDALGTVTPAAQVELRPQVSGVLTEVLFTEGQAVKKGQLLARIDARPFEQALAQARGVRAQNEAQLAVARQTLKRYETLWQQDSIARQDVDIQAALVAQLQGTLQSNRAVEETARINLGFTRITAPMGGRIGLRAVDAGNMVSAGAATGIATITQMVPIDVRFAVPQDRVREVLAAQEAGELPVAALDRTRDQTLAHGRFLTLDNVIDVATGTLQAKARFDNAESELFPNQFVNVRLHVGASAGVLVPVTAVRTGPDGDYVYVVDDERVAHMRSVRRGGSDTDEVLVAGGLQAGEIVVTEGGDRVKDGGKVQLVGDAAPAAPPAGAGVSRGERGPRGR